MREKLIELITDIVGFISWDNITDLADYLIENGVKIPVRSEECRKRKTEECGMNLKTAYYYHSWEDDDDYCSNGEPKEKGKE